MHVTMDKYENTFKNYHCNPTFILHSVNFSFRDGMFNMKEVYQYNPALGDPNSPEILKKITENAQKLNDLQAEYRKFQVCLLQTHLWC